MLPQEFVEYVILGTGDKLLESHATDTSSWSDRIEEHCRNTPHGNFLLKSAGNLDLKDLAQSRILCVSHGLYTSG